MRLRVATLSGAVLLAFASAETAPARTAQTIPLATGSGVTTLPEPRPPFFDITKYGAVAGGPATANQKAINDAITAAAAP
jgi:hypothetical protein